MAKNEKIKSFKPKRDGVGNLSTAKKKRLTFDLPASLHAKLKITAVKRDETMGEIVLKMLEEYLK